MSVQLYCDNISPLESGLLDLILIPTYDTEVAMVLMNSCKVTPSNINIVFLELGPAHCLAFRYSFFGNYSYLLRYIIILLQD